MEKLKWIKEELVTQVSEQMKDLSAVNTHELGEVIDMIKDLSECMYYCSVVEAMEETTDDKEMQRHYLDKYLPEQTRNTHHKKQSVEEYISQMSQDITEMAQTATSEEKAMLQKKLSALSSKIM